MLMEDASRIYFGAFLPLAIAAGLVAFFVNLLLYASLGDLRALFWAIAVSFFATAMLSAAAVLPMAKEAREGRPATAGIALQAVRLNGGRFLLAVVPLAIVNAFLVLVWVGIPVSLFLIVRFSLFGPAIFSEEADVTDAMGRSWSLVGGAWLRTGGILFMAVTPLLLLELGLLVLDLPAIVSFVLTVGGQALVAPFVIVITLLMFEDYRQIDDEDEEQPPGPPPSLWP